MITCVRKYSIFITSLLFTLPLQIQADALLTSTLDEILSAKCLDKSQTAVSIISVPSNESVYSRNALAPLLPASVMKIVTTVAALDYLGPEYRFKTEFLYTGQRSSETILGDLYIRGRGDPKLTPEKLWQIAMQIKGRGISHITGNLMIDTSFFDNLDRPPAWQDKRTQRAYDAGLSALSVNFNTVAVHVHPGISVGDEVAVWLEPWPDSLTLDISATTTASGRNRLSVTRSSEAGSVKVSVKGQLPMGESEAVFYRNIENPARYAAETFFTFLRQAGVRIDGVPQTGRTTPANAKPLYTYMSQPLAMVLKELNTYSNNFIAEQLIKTLAAEISGAPGSHAEGTRLVMNFLRKYGIDTRGTVIVDGSGLSRQNQLSTQAIVDVLSNAYIRFDIGPDFLASLPVLGAEGGAKKRFLHSPARAQIRAKTGTLNGVSTLAGYVSTQIGRVYSYAIFLNNNRCGHRGADSIENKLVNAIYTLGDSY